MFDSFIKPLVAQHGYWAVFLIVMFESAGAPLPGETALVLAAVFAGATGELDIALVIALAVVAAILGDNIGYLVGRRYGLSLLQRYGRVVRLTPERLALGDYLFARHGAKIVFFGRFVAFLRIFAALLAGVHRFPWRPFLFYNAMGGLIWACVFGIGGYWFGEALTRVTGPLGIAAFIAAALGVIGMLFVAKRHEQRFMREAARDAALRQPHAPAP